MKEPIEMRLQRGLQTAAAILAAVFLILLGIAFITGGIVADSKGETDVRRWVMIGVGFTLVGLVIGAAAVVRRVLRRRLR